MSKFEFDFIQDPGYRTVHGNKEPRQWYEAMEEISPILRNNYCK